MSRRPACGASVLLFLIVAAAPAGHAETGDFGQIGWLDGALHGDIYALPPTTRQLPDFSRLTPMGALYARELNVPPRDWRTGFPGITQRFEWFAIDYNGEIHARQPGRYQLRLVSDDGARVFIDDRLVIDNDGLHPPRTATGAVDLDTQIHRIRIQYFQGPRYFVALQLFCTAPGEPERLFPNCDMTLATPLKAWWR
jgi:fibro-slime domain-containing protein